MRKTITNEVLEEMVKSGDIKSYVYETIDIFDRTYDCTTTEELIITLPSGRKISFEIYSNRLGETGFVIRG